MTDFPTGAEDPRVRALGEGAVPVSAMPFDDEKAFGAEGSGGRPKGKPPAGGPGTAWPPKETDEAR